MTLSASRDCVWFAVITLYFTSPAQILQEINGKQDVACAHTHRNTHVVLYTWITSTKDDFVLINVIDTTLLQEEWDMTLCKQHPGKNLNYSENFRAP